MVIVNGGDLRPLSLSSFCIFIFIFKYAFAAGLGLRIIKGVACTERFNIYVFFITSKKKVHNEKKKNAEMMKYDCVRSKGGFSSQTKIS